MAKRRVAYILHGSQQQGHVGQLYISDFYHAPKIHASLIVLKDGRSFPFPFIFTRMLEQKLKQLTVDIFKNVFDADVPEDAVTINVTKKEHEGDFTIVVFPLIKFSKKNPEQTAEALGAALKEQDGFIAAYNVIKGFLNIKLSDLYWLEQLQNITTVNNYGTFTPNHKKVLLEYCGPNTNKPLHIGHCLLYTSRCV